MKHYFRKTVCPHCHSAHDAIENTCPFCGYQDRSARDFYAFEHQVRDSIPFQLTYFLVGLLGLRIIATIIQIIMEFAYVGSHPGASVEEILNYLTQIEVSFLLQGLVYGFLFLAMWLIILIGRRGKRFIKSFAGWKPYVAGLLGFVAIIAISTAYTNIISAIFRAAGIGDPGVNQNEQVIRQYCAAFPVWSLIIFGLIGPFCEEVTYRVGLFGLCGRLGKPLAYILSALVFGAIHFNWNVFSGNQGLATMAEEFAYLPTYIGSGLALAFIYDRFGFGASYTAHALNNLFSVTMSIIQGAPNA